MNATKFFHEIRKANHHRGGLKCLKLFQVKPEYFESLVGDVQRVLAQYAPSDVAQSSHATNWTQPFGNAIQYSLLNTSGRLDDFSTDHNSSIKNKRFHYSDEFTDLGRFIRTFAHATNMRLNGMGGQSGLSPHEEHTVHYTGGRARLRARFHLPIVTNEEAEMLLEDELYRFEAGSVYYFNNGCIHAARNLGESFRYHLVWDMMFTEETYALMFSEDGRGVPEFLTRLVGDDRVCEPVGHEPLREYAISGDGRITYKKWGLDRLGIRPESFHNFYNNVVYFGKSGHRFEFTDVQRPPHF